MRDFCFVYCTEADFSSALAFMASSARRLASASWSRQECSTKIPGKNRINTKRPVEALNQLKNAKVVFKNMLMRVSVWLLRIKRNTKIGFFVRG